MSHILQFSQKCVVCYHETDETTHRRDLLKFKNENCTRADSKSNAFPQVRSSQ